MQQLILVTWKSLLIFAMLIILTRGIGRKLLSQMSTFDYIVGITIGTISGAYVVQMVKGMWVLLSPIILALLTVSFSYINMKSVKIRKITEGEPVIIIQNGKILEKNMDKLRYNLDELRMQLRDKGVFNFADVEFAILEADGKLSMLKKSQNQPVTPKDLKIKTEYQGLDTEIIRDGKIQEENLKQNNLSFGWLYEELKKNNINRISDVVFATLNTDGTLYIDIRNDNLNYTQKIED